MRNEEHQLEASAYVSRPVTLHGRVTDEDLDFARTMVDQLDREGLVEVIAELAAQARIAREAGLSEVQA